MKTLELRLTNGNGNMTKSNFAKNISTLFILLAGFHLSSASAFESEAIREIKYLINSIESSQGKLDCRKKLFQPTASTKSLISWSKDHHATAQSGLDNKTHFEKYPHEKFGIVRACKESIRMRGAATCQEPNNEKYRSAFNKSVSVCSAFFN